MIKKIFVVILASILFCSGSMVFAAEEITSPTPQQSVDSQSTPVPDQTQTNLSQEESENSSNEVSNNEQIENQQVTVGETENNIDLEIDTGTNKVENSSVIDNFVSGDIEGQIAAVKSQGSTLAQGSEIEIKSASTDNEIDSADFNSMDSSFVVGNGETDLSSHDQFYSLSAEDTMNLDLNTGLNEFNRNTLVKNVATGDINFATNLFNLFALNDPELLLNLQVYSILGDFFGDIVVDELFTDESTAVEAFDQTIFNSTTNESISNSTNFDMNTGLNTLGQNTYFGDVQSGDAAGGYFQNDFAGLLTKSNYFIVNVLGEWDGANMLAGRDNIVVNTILDPEFFTPNESNSSETTQDTQIDIDQSLVTTANTGKNSFNNNTIVGNLKTGNISLLENVVNLKNNLNVLKNFLNIRIVNILGNWRGNMKGVQAATEEPTNEETGESPTDPSGNDNNNNSGNNSTNQNQVLGASQEVSNFNDPQILAQSNSNTNSGTSNNNSVSAENITAGTDLAYWPYLLLLIPLTGLVNRMRKA